MVKETNITFSYGSRKDEDVARLSWGSPTTSYGVILGHGASGNMDSGNLPSVAQAFADAGIWCLRYNSKSNLKGRVACCEVCLLQAQKKPAQFQKEPGCY